MRQLKLRSIADAEAMRDSGGVDIGLLATNEGLAKWFDHLADPVRVGRSLWWLTMPANPVFRLVRELFAERSIARLMRSIRPEDLADMPARITGAVLDFFPSRRLLLEAVLEGGSRLENLVSFGPSSSESGAASGQDGSGTQPGG